MKKIIFLTLVMIFGMSSVSFGKSYLCLTDEQRTINLNKEHRIVQEEKFIVKTLGNDRSMISVKEFGQNWYVCREGSDSIYTVHPSPVERGKSIRGDNFLSCRQTFIKIYGGHTHHEFILDLERMIFVFYWNSLRSHSISSLGITTGKCSEI